MAAEVAYHDVPMACCGMGMGYGMTDAVYRRMPKPNRWGETHRYEAANADDIQDRLRQLISRTSEYQRNCAMIVLSSEQQNSFKAVDIAKDLGFEVVKEFYNPNSENTCYIMVYTHFDSKDDYEGEWD